MESLVMPDNVNDVTDPVIVGCADGMVVNGTWEGNTVGLNVGDEVTNTSHIEHNSMTTF